MGFNHNYYDKFWNRFYRDKEVQPPEPDTLPPFEYQALQSGMYVMAAKEGEVWARSGSNNQRLWKSTDYGITWVNTINFPTESGFIYNVHILANGTMLVATATNSFDADAQGKILKSTDGGYTFTKVLDVLSGIPERWNVDSLPDGTVYVSEYGYKTIPNNARRIYKSTDFGNTWAIVYEPLEQNDFHMHKLIIDNYNPNTVYQSIGDAGVLEIIKTVDGGQNWETINTGAHPTSAINFENHIVWGLDGYPDYGIYLHDKETDTFSHIFKPEEGAGSAYTMMHHKGITYVGFMKYPDQTQPLSIYVSDDEGFTWKKWMSWDIESGNSGRIGLLMTDGVYGYTQSSGTGNEGSIRFELIK